MGEEEGRVLRGPHPCGLASRRVRGWSNLCNLSNESLEVACIYDAHVSRFPIG
jgi:hypothetical protein